MNVGPKTAVACWLSMMSAAAALLTFGLSNDSDAGLRDTVIELQLLQEGPTHSFVDYCKQFENLRQRGFFSEPLQSREAWALEQMRMDSNKDSKIVSSNFKMNGLLWCPFPTKGMTVRESLDVVSNLNNSSLTLWPHSTLLSELGRAIKENSLESVPSLSPDQKGWRFYSLAKDISEGARIEHIDVTSDRQVGFHGGAFECVNTDVIFDPYPGGLPTSPIQLIFYLDDNQGTGIYCLNANDLPPNVEALYGFSGNRFGGLLGGYFAQRIQQMPGYSNEAATRFEIRDVSPKKRGIPDEIGITPANEVVDFDFPAIRERLPEIGSLTLDDAYNSLQAKAKEQDEIIDVFGMELTLVPFLIAVVTALPILGLLFLGGLHKHGSSALPEVIQGLPKVVRGFVVLGGVSVLPACGLYFTSCRVTNALPPLVAPLQISAIGWAILSLGLLVWVYLSRRSN